MDRLLASFLLVLACVQVETLFVGAYRVSQRTDWERLGQYAQQEIRLLAQRTTTTETTVDEPAPKASKTLFVDSTESEEEER